MSSNESDSNKIKRSIMLRYPFTFFEEVSRALIIFKTFRGNKKIFRALPIMDELIDYVNIDPLSGKYLFEMSEDERKHAPYELIDLPAELVVNYKSLYHGTDQEYDGNLGFKHLSPGTSADANKPTVFIRKPISFVEAYGDHPVEWTFLIAGFKYEVQETLPSGFTVTKPIPMVTWEDTEKIQATYTHEIPYVVWSQMFERVWAQMAPVATRIERIIAAALAKQGITEASMSESQMPNNDDPNDEDEDNLML